MIARAHGATAAGPLFRAWRLRSTLLLLSLMLLLALAAAGMLTSHVLSIGQSRLAVIESTRVLESAFEHLHQGAVRYVEHAPRDYPDYWRDTTLHFAELKADLAQIDQSMVDLGRTLHGLAQPGLGGWPGARLLDRAIARHAELSRFWEGFAQEHARKLGPTDQPRLEWGAAYIVAEAAAVRRHLDRLLEANRELVDAQLRFAENVMRVGIPAGYGLLMLCLLFYGARLFNRLGRILQVSAAVARGRFGEQAPLDRADELSELAAAINRISRNTAIVLDLIERIGQSQGLNALLRSTATALAPLLALRSLALHPAGESGSGQAMVGAALAKEDLAVAGSSRDQSDGEEEPRHLALLLTLRHGPGYWLRLSYEASAPVSADDQELLRNIAPLIAHGADRSLLTENLLTATVEGLARLAESRDPETGDHLLRMARYSRVIGEALLNDGDSSALPASDCVADQRFLDDLERFAPMHDIGKVGVADAILRKPGSLTVAEREAMQLHPVIGAAVLRACSAQLPAHHRSIFQVAIDIAEAHHERYDGSGYPHGLRGLAIPLAARIVAVADVLDALTTRRPYKEAWDWNRAYAWLIEQSGSHFDPMVVAAAVRCRSALEQVADAVNASERPQPPSAPAHDSLLGSAFATEAA